MKRLLMVCVVVVLTAIGQAAVAANIQFDFVSEPANGQPLAAFIEFKGAPSKTLDFPNAGSGYDFIITRSDTSGLVNLKGNIDGTFNVGAITTAGILEIAPVTGTGTFSITDPVGKVLSATVAWNDVFVVAGSQGGLNTGNTANLTGWTYGGTYLPLLQIKNGADQSANISFQFNPSKTLAQLMANGADNKTTYSGSFSAVPEPSTFVLMAGGALGLLAVGRLRRKTA
jgi:hypothetical protein